MTITDEELYRLAHNAHCYANHGFGLSGTSSNEINGLRRLRDAVLQRFKPREPRVIERWVVVRNDGTTNTLSIGDRVYDLADGDYLAKAVITEVMEDA